MIEIIQVAILVMTNVFVVLNTILVLKYVFGRDMRHDAKSLAITGASFLLFDIGISFLPQHLENFAFILICIALCICVLFMTRSKRIITFVLIIPAILFYIQTGSILTTFEHFTGLDKFQTIASNDEVITPLFVLCDPFLFVLLLLLIHKTDRRIQNTALNAWEVITLTVFSAVGYFAAGVIGTLKEVNFYYFVISALILFAFEALLLYAIYHRKRSGYYRRLSAEYKKQFESEYLFFKDYKATQEDTIRFRHDWQNHMLLIRQMLAKGEYTKAEAYFSDLSANTPEGNTKVATGCELADMMIHLKSENMEDLNIKFHFKGNLNELNVLEQVDCCILLSNLLDNAIEANAKIHENRYITLVSRQTEELFYLEMKNPCKEELRTDGQRILSTKKTDTPCGIGLENIKAIISKYHGECRYFTEDGEYVFQMLLCSNQAIPKPSLPNHR